MKISPEVIKVHSESHLGKRTNWLRATVLGANDGILSTASIITGMAVAHSSHKTVLLAGLASLVAGATAMATGEYVSVSSQSDIEKADLRKEKHALAHNPEFEQEELAQIYVTRGVELALARQVAGQMMSHDALGAHARDELGMSDLTSARPIQAALASAASFTAGAALPLGIVAFAPPDLTVWSVTGASLLSLALLGAISARTSGTGILMPTLRVLFWGGLSMWLTAWIGSLFGVAP
jgi:VIT1/CCC1 family predicted Fe2+/Mn2+ transporter